MSLDVTGAPIPIGAVVTGGRGELLGHVGAIYVEHATGRPTWAAVRGSRHTAVVPLVQSRFDGATLHVPFAAEQLRGAPHHDPAAELTHQDGEDLYRHYGVAPPDVTPGTAEGGTATGNRALVRSEERLRVGSAYVVVGRARLVKRIVSEDVTVTVPVRREEVHVEYDLLPEHEQVTTALPPTDDVREVVRYEEQVQVTTRVVPVERVRLVRRVVTTEQVLADEVRAERLDLDVSGRPTERPGDSR